jgi:hypothetical protein
MSSETSRARADTGIQEVLGEALKLIDYDDYDGKEYLWRGSFPGVFAYLRVVRPEGDSLKSLVRATESIGQDIWNVCIPVTRLEWFRALAGGLDRRDTAIHDRGASTTCTFAVNHQYHGNPRKEKRIRIVETKGR